jgi:uncharacterized protein (TIGR02452 family)
MKHKKKNAYSVAEQNIKILKSGKIKIQKGQKISLVPYITDSVANTVCSRIDAIISKEEVVVDTTNCRLDTTSTLSTMRKTVEMLSRIEGSGTQTVIHIINKKNAIEIFDFMDDSIVGTLLRSSTLAAIYKKIKDDWFDLNESDKTQFTNILFIPDILVFLDEDTGKVKKIPHKVNLLLVAEPSLKAMATGVERVTSEQAVERTINDVFASAIKCGAKNLVIAPYCHKIFLEDPYTTAGVWHDYTTIQKSIENLNNVNFAVNNDDLYIIFMKNNSYNKMNSDLTK